MGIEEAILQDVREQSESLTKVQGIQRLLAENIFPIGKIAKIFDVEPNFVEQIQNGNIYIDKETNEIVDKSEC